MPSAHLFSLFTVLPISYRRFVVWSNFLREIASGTIAGVVAGAIVVSIGYWLVDRRVHLRDALDRQRESEEDAKHNRDAALTAVYVELESDAAALTTALDALAKRGIPYPLFDTTTLTLALAPSIFTTLKPQTVKALLQAHNRMVTANEQHAFVYDLCHGPTAILTTMATAGSMDDAGTRTAYETFEAYRETMRAALLTRCENLKPYLDAAIDAVESELGIEGVRPAAKRLYLGHEPIGYVEARPDR